MMAAANIPIPRDQRQKELALIHIAKKDLQLTDESYRDILKRVANKESSKDLDAVGRDRVLAEFKRLGWQYRKSAPKRAGNRRPATSAIAGKARALWLSLYQLGAIPDPSEAALVAFAKRQTGVDDIAWITPQESDSLIEALKSRCARHGYVATLKNSDRVTPEEMRREPDANTRGYNALLIEAQWNKLIGLGVMRHGSHARLDTWLGRQGLACGHQIYLTVPEQRTAIEKLGRWIRTELQTRGQAADE